METKGEKETGIFKNFSLKLNKQELASKQILGSTVNLLAFKDKSTGSLIVLIYFKGYCILKNWEILTSEKLESSKYDMKDVVYSRNHYWIVCKKKESFLALNSETGEKTWFNSKVEGDIFGKSLITLFNGKYICTSYQKTLKFFYYNEEIKDLLEVGKRNLRYKFKDFIAFGEQNNYILASFGEKSRAVVYRIKEISRNKILIELRNFFILPNLFPDLKIIDEKNCANVVYSNKSGSIMIFSFGYRDEKYPISVLGYNKEKKKVTFKKSIKGIKIGHSPPHTIGMIENPFENFYSLVAPIEVQGIFYKLIFNFKNREYLLLIDKTLCIDRIYKFYYINGKVYFIGNEQELVEIEFEFDSGDLKCGKE